MRVWDPPSDELRERSRALFGSGYQLPVLAAIGRLRAQGDAVFTYDDLRWEACIGYQDTRNRVARLVDAGLLEVVDDEWRHYFRAVDSPMWDSFARLFAEWEDQGVDA